LLTYPSDVDFEESMAGILKMIPVIATVATPSNHLKKYKDKILWQSER
jgi:hypothetical protein